MSTQSYPSPSEPQRSSQPQVSQQTSAAQGAVFYGGFSGQYAQGNNNVLIQHNYQKSPISRYTHPASRLPFPEPNFLDRQNEFNLTLQALNNRQPVEISGPFGIGKSSFLNNLANNPNLARYPDGIGWLEIGHKNYSETLLAIYQLFYQVPSDNLPTDGRMENDLQGIRAVILLDEVDLSTQDLNHLVNVIPNSLLILACPERRLGRGESFKLRGLLEQDCLEIMVRILKRSLSVEEIGHAREIIQECHGHPDQVKKAAYQLYDGEATFTSLARRTASEPIDRQVAVSLPAAEREIAAYISAADNTSISINFLTSLTGRTDTPQLLQVMEQKGLAQSHSPRYSLTGYLAKAIKANFDLEPYALRLLATYTRWSESQSSPAVFSEEADVLVSLLNWAGQAQKWVETLDLAQACSNGLMLSRRWGAWRTALEWALVAARALGDRFAEAWALHQLGSRLGMLGEKTLAEQVLGQSLGIRQQIGDTHGASISQHNLSVLRTPPPPPPKGGIQGTPPGKPWVPILFVVGALAVTGIFYALTRPAPEVPLPPPETATFTVEIPAQATMTPTETIDATWTTTPSPTNTFTPSVTVTGTLPPTVTPTRTSTITPTFTATNTLTPSMTPSITPTFTHTPTPTMTFTPTPLPCITFEDRPLNRVYTAGSSTNTFKTNNSFYHFKISNLPTYLSYPTPGTVTISTIEGKAGQVAKIDNGTFRFLIDQSPLPHDLQYIFLEYSLLDSNSVIVLSVNFDRRENEALYPYYEDPTMLVYHKVKIGGVEIFVNEERICSGIDEICYSRGTIMLTGNIFDFGIGGEEIWVDNICPYLEQPKTKIE